MRRTHSRPLAQMPNAWSALNATGPAELGSTEFAQAEGATHRAWTGGAFDNGYRTGSVASHRNQTARPDGSGACYHQRVPVLTQVAGKGLRLNGDHGETAGEEPASEGAASSFPRPANEPQRLAALRTFGILDTAPEIAYDEIAELAAQLCCCPVAYISFIDETRRWLKARYGLPLEAVECPRADAVCTTTICGTEVLVVPDMKQDPRFDHSPLVMSDPPCRFYCGMPLITDEGYALGARVNSASNKSTRYAGWRARYWANWSCGEGSSSASG